MRVIPYDGCSEADLVVDAVYEGALGSHLIGEALSKLLPGVGNQGGFRPSGRGEDKKFVALFTSGEDRDWPDTLDLGTGQLAYYGDNKRPGHELHDTQRNGNGILRHVFSLLHSAPPDRSRIPPFFVFRKYPTSVSARSVQFKGVAVPGFFGMPPTADLVAVWKSSEGQRFQNYRAIFTILNIDKVSRAWIRDLEAGLVKSEFAPRAWQDWVATGRYNALTAESTTVIRNVESQLPDTAEKRAVLETIWRHFADAPIAFEAFAARLFSMQDPRVIVDEITRASVDGGRDATGRYLLGLSNDPVYAEFSLEAKCYCPGLNGENCNTVGVKEVSRLISRIRHRQFGVLVTTSAISRQAYEEVREDRHPIVFLSGGDLVNILAASGYGSQDAVVRLLRDEFAVSS